ncbi:MAG: phosphatase PAP2 family protein [Verrucomicrobiota bacterium]|jgi:membrane-associated phospholipid phosphatase
MTEEERQQKSECEQPGNPAPHSRPAARSLFGHYTFIDYATQGYMALVGLIVLCWHGRLIPFWPRLLAAHVIGIALVDGLIRLHASRPSNRVLGLLRDFYPMLLYAGFYRETGELNHVLAAGFLDPFFIRLEGRIFGLQPSLALMDWLPCPAVSELFYAAYFSYYVMVAGVGLALFYRNREQFSHYLSVISLLFYVCFLIYIFLPVQGPRVFFREFASCPLPADVQPLVAPVLPGAVQAGPFCRLMAWIYYAFDRPGAAFPSSHVAVAIGTVCFSFRYLRPIRWPHLVAVVLLCVATVYCRYHYVVDVMAGGVTAAVLIPLGNRLYFKFRNAPQPEPPLRESESS